VWDLERQESLCASETPFKPDGCQIAVSPVGDTVAWAPQIDVLHVSATKTKKPSIVLQDCPSDSHCPTFSPDGRLLASHRGQSGEILIWELATGRLRQRIDTGHGVLAKLAWSADAHTIAVSAQDRTIGLWDVESGRAKLSIGRMPVVTRAFAFSPDGRTLVTGEFGDRVRFWHVATGQELFSLPPESGCHRPLEFSPDGRILLCAGKRPDGKEQLVLLDR
jgi:WD40 repeat protein